MRICAGDNGLTGEKRAMSTTVPAQSVDAGTKARAAAGGGRGGDPGSAHKAKAPRARDPRSLRVPRRVSTFMVLMSLWDLYAVHRPGLMARLDPLVSFLPSVATAVPGVSVALGLLIIGFARSLSRGKRQAWQVGMVLLLVEAVLQAAQQHRIGTVFAVVMLVTMYRVRREFVAIPDPGSRTQAIAIGLAFLVSSLAIGFVSLTLLADSANLPVSVNVRLIADLQGLVGIPSLITEAEGRYEDVVYFMLLSMGLLTVIVTGFLLFRSPPLGPRRDAEEEELLRNLLSRYGANDSLSYFAARTDRSVVVSPNKQALVSYRVVAGTALAAGDPIGPPSQWPDAIAAFLDLARQHAWTPAVVAAGQQGAQQWIRVGGLSALEFGDEAILEAGDFSLEGRKMRNLRHAVTRAERVGYTVSMARLRDLDAAAVAELRQQADAWRMGGEERGFSMALGRVDEASDPDSVAVRCLLDGELSAMLVLVPWGGDGLSLDLMRRKPNSESGVNELMVSELMAHLGDFGVKRVSLNFAVFRDAFERAERIGAGPIARAWGAALKFISRWSQADSLYRFNAKFEPLWEPRYLLFPTPASLPGVAIAYLGAEGFVRLPQLHFARHRHLE